LPLKHIVTVLYVWNYVLSFANTKADNDGKFCTTVCKNAEN